MDPTIAIVLVLVLGIPLLFWAVFLYQTRRVQQPTTVNPPLPVSIIVCAHDEEENLKQLLPLLLAQDHPNFEIILVNDRSNDGTYDFLLQQEKLYGSLRILTVRSKPDHVSGKKFALTLGIKAATHDIVLLTDADCRPGPAWASTMSMYFTEGKDIVLGISPYAYRSGILQAFIRFEALLTSISFISMARAGMPYMGVGRNLAYRKRLFFESKGFNRHMSITGGDDDLFVNDHATKENTETCIAPEAVVYSNPVETWNAFRIQKMRHLSVGKYYRLSHRFVLGFWGLTTMIQIPSALVVLLFFNTSGLWILLLIRWIIMGWTMNRFAAETKVKSPGLETPLLDLAYSVYFLITAPLAFFARRIPWKN